MARKLTEELIDKERQRLFGMAVYERRYGEFQWICGIDEAGRGPLAGPVVAAAVMLPRECEILFLNDSKKLSEKKREQLFEEIQEKAVSCGVGIVSPAIIDEVNILQATYQAMKAAISQLTPLPEVLLNDAVIIPGLEIKQEPIIKGDTKSVSIAAASIIAKVTRDNMMREYDKQFPEYGFAKHKGYGTKTHIEAILTHGSCPIHRNTFITKWASPLSADRREGEFPPLSADRREGEFPPLSADRREGEFPQ